MEGAFSRGVHTLTVHNKLHQLNRRRLVERLKQVDSLKKGKSIVILQGGQSETRHCTDHEPIFRQESYFHWAFGVEEPDYYGAIEIDSGQSHLFAPRLPSSYAIWMGKLKSPEDIRYKYGVENVHFSDVMKQILVNLHADNLLLLHGVNSDSGKVTKEAFFEGINQFKVDKSILYPLITECRVFKTPFELEVLRYANKISCEAHIDVMKKVRPGMKEYQLESLFRHYCYYNGGARLLSYTCICGSGINSSVLHYGHSGAPNDHTLKKGQLVLNDMGCEYYCYGADITCTFPVNGVFSDQQKIIYNAVLASSRAVMKAVRPGVSWVDMHLLAERTHLEHLIAAGLIQGNIDEMIKLRIPAIFMPHGLGHFLGIDTHDVGGYLEHTPPRPSEDGLKSLRTSRVLEPGMVLTIEPGIYFIGVLLDKILADPVKSKFLVKEKIDQFRDFGGVRIEDNIVVTETGMELLTNVPRTIEEIETLMAEGAKLNVQFPQQNHKSN